MSEQGDGDGAPTGGDGGEALAERAALVARAERELLVPVRFEVRDFDAAAWLVRRVAQLRQYCGEVDDWAEREKRRARQDEERLLYLFGAQLRAWIDGELRRRGGRRRSIDFPCAAAGYRRIPQKLNVLNRLARL